MRWLCLFLALLFAASASQRKALPADFDPYRVLHAYRGATKAEIRSAYRRALNVMGRAAAKHGHGQEASMDDSLLMEDIKTVSP